MNEFISAYDYKYLRPTTLPEKVLILMGSYHPYPSMYHGGSVVYHVVVVGVNFGAKNGQRKNRKF